MHEIFREYKRLGGFAYYPIILESISIICDSNIRAKLSVHLTEIFSEIFSEVFLKFSLVTCSRFLDRVFCSKIKVKEPLEDLA